MYAAEAEFNDEIIPLHLRVAWGSEINRCRNDCIYYDMCDPRGRIIEISKNGWEIIERNRYWFPILFKKYNQQPQVEPDRNYPSDIFDQLLNLTNVKSRIIGIYLKSISFRS